MLVIIHGKIETMAGTTIPDGQIFIENGLITAIGSEMSIPADATVIDAAGRTVTPGLIEAHTHVGIGEEGIGWAGNDVNESTGPITPWCDAIDGINMLDSAFDDYREAGITTVNILPGSANILGGTSTAVKCKGKIVDEAILLHPSGMKSALGENPKVAYGNRKKAPTTRMGTAALLREALHKAKDYQKKREHPTKSGNVKYDRTSEALLPLLEGQYPLRIHCHRADDIVTAVRIAREFDLKYTLEHITDGYLVLDFLEKYQVPCAVGPTLHYGSKVENRNRDFRTPVLLSWTDVPFCLITDHPVVAGQYLPVIAGTAVSWGMNWRTALRSITLGAAEHIGVNDRIGSLEVGKDADLVIWSGDPLDFTTFADLTIIDGQVVHSREVK